MVHTRRVRTTTGTPRLLGLELVTSNVADSLRFYNWLVDPDVHGATDSQVAARLRAKGVLAVRTGRDRPTTGGWLPVMLVPSFEGIDGLSAAEEVADLPALDGTRAVVRYFTDSNGVVTGIAESAGGRLPSARLGGSNVDYITSDPARTAAEQGRALGLTVLRLIDDAYDARLLCDESFVVAGVLRFGSTFEQQADQGWLCYLGVDDVDAAMSRAVAAGARTVVPASNSGLNRYAVLVDPWGTPFGVSSTVADHDVEDVWAEGPNGRVPLSALTTMI